MKRPVSVWTKAVALLLAVIHAGMVMVSCTGTSDPSTETDGATAAITDTASDSTADTPAATEQPTETPTEGETEEPVIPLPELAYPTMPKAKGAHTLYLLSRPSPFCERLTVASLQGIVARYSEEQVFLASGAYQLYMPYFESDYNCKVETKLNGEDLSLYGLAAYFKPYFKGYILCADTSESESVDVAISLAGVLDCLIATPANEQAMKDLGLTCILDVTDKDDAWLRQSEYWDKLSRTVAVEQPCDMTPRLADYAVMSGAYFNFYSGDSGKEHKAMFEFLDDNAVVLGYNNDLGEFETVRSLAQINVQLLPSDHAFNLSVHSGFTLKNNVQKTEKPSDGKIENVHTVCFILSDGDNMQWMINDYATTDRWFNSPVRGQFNMGWGLPTTAAEMIAPMTSYLYDTMSPKDEFIMQLSGLGYTFPSGWEKYQRRILAANVAAYMKSAGLSYMEILDSDGFGASVFEDFTEQDGIEDIFYIDYENYAGEHGDIIWTNGKPAVAARYKLWEGTTGNPDDLAKRLNRASTDVTSDKAYSFVIVHAWSGMKEGVFGSGGSSVEAVAAVIAQLEDHVEVVTPSEFMARIKANVEH